MSFSHIVTSNYVSVMNLETGNVTKIQSSDPKFTEAIGLVKAGRFADVEQLTVKNQVNSFVSTINDNSGFVVKVERGAVMYSFNGGAPKELHNAMTERILNMLDDGFDAAPFVAFMTNLLSNPSKTAIDELYLFLEATGLPITTDGHFIAYKMVNENYTSIHDNKFRNDVGTVVEMPRHEVDDNRNQTCSTGLHFCSKEYLPKYGSAPGTRLLLVKINPADVVSIPSDYNNSKGRAAKYLIWKDITEPGWREKYGVTDYNTQSVEAGDWDDSDWDEIYDENKEDSPQRAACPKNSGAFIRGYVNGYNDCLDGECIGTRGQTFNNYREQWNYEEGYYSGQEDAKVADYPRYY